MPKYNFLLIERNKTPLDIAAPIEAEESEQKGKVNFLAKMSRMKVPHAN